MLLTLLLVGALLALALNFIAHQFYFAFLPQAAIRVYEKTDPERLARYLERVVATPSLMGPRPKFEPRLALIQFYFLQGRHAEAAVHCGAYLEDLTKARRVNDSASHEAKVRRLFADCLEGLGRTDEADQERGRADACLATAPDDTLRWLTKGQALKRDLRFAEACEAFEKALELTPKEDIQGQILCKINLVLSCQEAGRPAESLRWSEEAIVLGAEGFFSRTAHKMASIACGHLGRFEESEEHCRLAYNAAAAEGDVVELGDILGLLGEVQRKRGKLDEAYESCRKASEIAPNAIRTSVAVQFLILRGWGRFDEALEMLRRHGESPGLAVPAGERRLMAIRAMERSRIEAESGRADDAWVHIQEALSVLGNDPVLGLHCDAAHSWVLAARGLADESRRVADLVLTRLPDFELNPNSCRIVMFDLGMAICTRGEHEKGIDCWSRYLGMEPYPVNRPTALYFRGECRRQLGDLSGAKADYTGRGRMWHRLQVAIHGHKLLGDQTGCLIESNCHAADFLHRRRPTILDP